MTVERTPTEDVGVIVGRFQAHEFHEGHIDLINEVLARHARVIVFLGLSPLRGTIADPLDFSARKAMFAEAFPDIDVFYVNDCRENTTWAPILDREIIRQVKPRQTIRLYGSRDSFIKAYEEGGGTFPTTELEAKRFISSTEIRKRIAVNYKPTKDYRAGVIAAAFDRWIGCQPTVDIAVVRSSEVAGGLIPKDILYTEILLGKKPKEDWRFIGGFADPASESYEADALRELHEEAGPIEVSKPMYVGSCIIDDWRFRKQPNKIKTSFFVSRYIFGRPQAGDDIESVGWHPLVDLFEGKIKIVPEHLPLVEMLGKVQLNALAKF